MPGPLPKQTRRRRNAPTIPTTSLPASGRKGPVPDPPSWLHLRTAGRAWWDWAWKSPQAAAWSPEAHGPMVAHRAKLEDDLAAAVDVKDAMAVTTKITAADDRLGLSPKSMAQLRWTIVDDSEADDEVEHTGNVVTPDRWKRTGT